MKSGYFTTCEMAFRPGREPPFQAAVLAAGRGKGEADVTVAQPTHVLVIEANTGQNLYRKNLSEVHGLLAI